MKGCGQHFPRPIQRNLPCRVRHECWTCNWLGQHTHIGACLPLFYYQRCALETWFMRSQPLCTYCKWEGGMLLPVYNALIAGSCPCVRRPSTSQNWLLSTSVTHQIIPRCKPYMVAYFLCVLLHSIVLWCWRDPFVILGLCEAYEMVNVYCT